MVPASLCSQQDCRERSSVPRNSIERQSLTNNILTMTLASGKSSELQTFWALACRMASFWWLLKMKFLSFLINLKITWGFLFALKGKTCNLCHCRAEAMVLKSVELYYGKIWMCHMTVRPSVPTGKLEKTFSNKKIQLLKSVYIKSSFWNN